MKAHVYSYLLVSICLFLVCSEVFATEYTWKPASGTSGKNKANWRTTCGTAGSTFPSSGDTLVFNASCSIASCVLDTTFNVRMIDVRTSYTGTISTSTGITLTFEEGKFKGGTFTGGSIPITFNKLLEINGTAFTSTSGTMNIIGDFTYKGTSFSHNNGTIIFKRASNVSTFISGTSNATICTLYKAEFAAPIQNTQYTIRNITMVVVNELKLTGTYQLFLNTSSASTIECKGNIISSNTNNTGGGTVFILINGTGSQSLSGSLLVDEAGKLPNITINKSSGTLSLSGILALGGSTKWTYTAGTVSEGTAKVLCTYNNTLHNNSGGTMQFHSLNLYGRGDGHTITGKVKVLDTIQTLLSGTCILDGDTLEAQGSIVWKNSSANSIFNAVVKLTGSNAQTISGTAVLPLSKVILSKTSGDITLLKSVNISSNIKFSSGYLISDATNLLIIKHGATISSASNNSFVKGPVKKIGNSAFTFPVGKQAYTRQLQLLLLYKLQMHLPQNILMLHKH